jgi:hypothetical protein
MAKKIYCVVDKELEVVKALISCHGFRPMLDAVAFGAYTMMREGKHIKDEYGEQMSDEDIMHLFREVTANN